MGWGAEQAGAAGGSGVIIIRGSDDDLRPLIINGTQVQDVRFNGALMSGLSINGTRIFAQLLRLIRRLWPQRRPAGALCPARLG